MARHLYIYLRPRLCLPVLCNNLSSNCILLQLFAMLVSVQYNINIWNSSLPVTMFPVYFYSGQWPLLNKSLLGLDIIGKFSITDSFCRSVKRMTWQIFTSKRLDSRSGDDKNLSEQGFWLFFKMSKLTLVIQATFITS